MIAVAITPWSLLSWAIPLAAFAGLAWAFMRGGGSTAIASLEAANRVLERRVHELEDSDERKTKRITELEARTDVALAIVPVLEALRTHEIEASRRAEASLAVLGLMAERLGPDPDYQKE
jgi:hypothetical protein